MMPLSQQQLQLIRNSVQGNAQAAVPVVPNNGNPGGANNMQRNQQQARAQARYPWLEPSPSVERIQGMLNEPLMIPGQQPAQPQAPVEPAAPAVQPPQAPMTDQVPVLPQKPLAEAPQIMPKPGMPSAIKLPQRNIQPVTQMPSKSIY